MISRDLSSHDDAVITEICDTWPGCGIIVDIAIINEPLAPVPHNVTMPEMATHSPGGRGDIPPPVNDYDGKNAVTTLLLANIHSRALLCEPGSSGVTTITYLSIDTGY